MRPGHERERHDFEKGFARLACDGTVRARTPFPRSERHIFAVAHRPRWLGSVTRSWRWIEPIAQRADRPGQQDGTDHEAERKQLRRHELRPPRAELR